jgi:8-oxo-dGTP pyrophosphatase MutT (NUDIX family)
MNQKKTRKTTTPPRATREFTAGGVVYRYKSDKVQILMIQDTLGRWSIPKGHVEEGEQLEQTAVREIQEETGLRELRILERLDKLHFFYRREGKLIFMTTFVYLVEALGDTDAIAVEEGPAIADVKWFDAEEALQLIEYKETQKLFRMGLSKLGRTAKKAA